MTSTLCLHACVQPSSPHFLKNTILFGMLMLFLLHFFLFIVLHPHYFVFSLSNLIWIVNWCPFNILMLLIVYFHSLFLHTLCECQVNSRLFRAQNHKRMCSPMHLSVNPFVTSILRILCLTNWKTTEYSSVIKVIIKISHFLFELYLKLCCCKDDCDNIL